MSRRRKIKTCIYCGKNCFSSDDHIPPRNLFDQLPANTITVPSCEACRRATVLDDEYFRNLLALREDIASNPVAKNMVEAMKRSFHKPEQIKFAKKIISDIEIVDVFSKGGIFLGKKHAINTNRDRLKKVVDRITKGLFFKKTKRIPANSISVLTLMQDELP